LNANGNNQVDLPGYDLISNHSINKAGGGSGLYLQDNFQYKLIGNCTVSNPEVIESLFVEIINPNGKNSIVGTIYRPPNQNIASFLEEINKILSIITKDNKHCYIMGDFNLDLLHYDSHHFTQEFLDSLFSHMLIPLVTKPTCVTSHSATLIDNIFTNCFQQNTLNGLILNDISDHFPMFAYFKKDSPTRRENEVIYKRDYAEWNLLKFQTALSQVNWSSVLIGEDQKTYITIL
jgi:hypothetical protein